jgi:flagellar biosynthesis protein FlhB
MDEGELDKSEQPTPFKLMRGREKGTVARGTDLGFLTGLAAFLGFAWVAGRQFESSLNQAFRGALVGGPTLADGNNATLAAVAAMLSTIEAPVVLMAGTIFLVVLLFELVQTGGVFSSEPLKPDFSRLNPAKGLKRLFTVRLLLETAKNILKLCLYTTVVYLVVRGAIRSDAGTITDGRSLFAAMGQVAARLVACFVCVAFLFAALDQIIVRRQFLKKMRMSRREVRREARDREGDPRLKQKRRQLHAEFAKLSQSLRNLRGADVLITNPQHIALGLRYDRKTMHAPTIVSVGTNQFAQRLKRLAFIYGIPIVENRALAQELLRKSGLSRPVPEHCFRSVADVYNTLQKNKTGKLGRQ